MSFNLGLNVVETDGKATPSIVAAPTSVAGFSIRSARGVRNEVTKITNWQQFQETFGSFMNAPVPDDDIYGAYTIRGYFDNGGTTAYVTRVLGPASSQPTAASLTSDFAPWNLDNGDILTFDIDGNDVDVTFNWHATRLEALDPQTLDPPSDTYNLLGVEMQVTTGEGSSDIYTYADSDFASGDAAVAEPDEVANIINREFAGIKSFVESGKVIIETDLSTNIQIDGNGSSIENLFSTLTASRDSSDNVKDINNITLAEAQQNIAAALMSSEVTVEIKDAQIIIKHNLAGNSHTLTVDPQTTPDGFTFTPIEGSDTGVNAVAAAATTSIGSVLSFTAGRLGKEDMGAWANGKIKVEVINSERTDHYDLTITNEDVVVENWQGLSQDEASPKFFDKIINDPKYGSKYIKVTATGNATPVGAATLSGGNDGGPPVDNDYIASFDLFELYDVQLLCCPENTSEAVVKNGMTHCSNMGDRMYVGHTPKEQDANTMKGDYSGTFRSDKRYGALYFPWILVADPIGVNKWIPPTGHIMGVYARTERERGIWKAPAGNTARLKNVLDVYKHISDKQHTDLVKEASVNAVRYKSGKGIVIDSSRTLSTNPLWYYVNVRLLFNFVKSSLLSGLTWVVQEPNDPSLWNKVKFNSVSPFLMNMWRRGAFGPGSPDEVFTIKIDEENNTPADIQQGRLNLEVYFYPSRPAETIVIIVGQQEGGGSASEG